MCVCVWVSVCAVYIEGLDTCTCLCVCVCVCVCVCFTSKYLVSSVIHPHRTSEISRDRRVLVTGPVPLCSHAQPLLLPKLPSHLSWIHHYTCPPPWSGTGQAFVAFRHSVEGRGSHLLCCNQGEELTHSYGPHRATMPREDRQEMLLQAYKFTCQCEACQQLCPPHCDDFSRSVSEGRWLI